MSDAAYAQILAKLLSLENNYPNICRMWKYYLTEKKEGYIRSLQHCGRVISSLENDNIQDNIDQNIIFLCMMMHNNLL